MSKYTLKWLFRGVSKYNSEVLNINYWTYSKDGDGSGYELIRISKVNLRTYFIIRKSFTV